MVANGTVSPMPDIVERMEASDMRRVCSVRDGEPVVPLRSMKTLPLLWMHSTEPTKITLLTHLDKKSMLIKIKIKISDLQEAQES